MNKIPYNNQLKKLEHKDILFNKIELSNIPEPYYKDYSHETDPAYKNYKSWDRDSFKTIFLDNLNALLNDEVIYIKIITPRADENHFTVFAYLKSKHIAGLHIPNNGNFKAWMDVAFFDQEREERNEDIANGLYSRQPELDPNAPFMLSFYNTGGHSLTSVHTGMRVDEKPFENTGLYLHKKAPKRYNEAKITREKQNFIKKYIDTAGATINETELKQLFIKLTESKTLKINTPTNNETVYAEFETLTGYAFPNELKILLDLHNGTEDIEFLSAKQILTEWKNWKTIYDDPSWMLSDLKGNNYPDGRTTIGIYTNPYWIPFFNNGDGNHIAIDYAPGSKGKSGQIIAFGADATTIRFIANDMVDFIQQIIDGKQPWNNGFN